MCRGIKYAPRLVDTTYAMPDTTYAMPNTTYAMPDTTYAMSNTTYAMPDTSAGCGCAACTYLARDGLLAVRLGSIDCPRGGTPSHES